MGALVIGSTSTRKWIEFSDAEPKGVGTPVDTYVFTVQLDNLRASTGPLDTHNDFAKDGRRLARLFDEMAREWRGWKGEKAWRSTDGEVSLTFTHDRVGYVQVLVRVRDAPMANWEVTGKVPIELGSLENLAKDVAAYFRV